MDQLSNRQQWPARTVAREIDDQLAANLRRAFPVHGAADVRGGGDAGSFAGLLRALDERTR